MILRRRLFIWIITGFGLFEVSVRGQQYPSQPGPYPPNYPPQTPPDYPSVPRPPPNFPAPPVPQPNYPSPPLPQPGYPSAPNYPSPPYPQPHPEPFPSGGPHPPPGRAPSQTSYNKVAAFQQSLSHGQSKPGQGFPGQRRDGAQNTGDKCFRQFKNCIIVNAQPYERRSTISVEECKNLCLSQTSGTYTCRSFVYDNTNKVCDLFAHTGNQYPAKLIQFFGRDYYEPTGDRSCVGSPVRPTSGPGFGSGNSKGFRRTGDRLGAADPCQAGEVPRYLRIEGFELSGNDDNDLGATPLNQCIKTCNKDISCNSFDYVSGRCIITTEAAVPTGNGQLVQNSNADYYEQICVDSNLVENCPDVFERVPQMILVGFAETVVDATSFEECLDNCVNAQALYGFTCRSGMYYFEEPQLNCILNTENRDTQPDLFTEENNDIVDYFETGCTGQTNRLTARGRFKTRAAAAAVLHDIDSEVNTIIAPSVGVGLLANQPAFGEWTQWSPCDRKNNGRRVRYKRCRKPNLKRCPAETEWCNRKSDPANVLNLDGAAASIKTEESIATNGTTTKALSKTETLADESGIPCPPDVCCPVFGGCRIGLELSSTDQKTHWCTDPCKNKS